MPDPLSERDQLDPALELAAVIARQYLAEAAGSHVQLPETEERIADQLQCRRQGAAPIGGIGAASAVHRRPLRIFSGTSTSARRPGKPARR